MTQSQDFSQVDRAADPSQFVRSLDLVSGLQQVQAAKQLTFDLLELQEGNHVLDVGCGTGDDVLALAKLVGSGGRVVGVDNSVTMIEEARKRAQDTELTVEFREGDVLHLDFPNSSFDTCRANRVLTHLQEPEQALKEMARMVRVGGKIVCFDRDWESFLIDGSDEALTRQITHIICARFPNGWMGRHLFALFISCGLADVKVLPDTLVITDFAFAEQAMELRSIVQQATTEGVITHDQAKLWLDEQEERGRSGQFFAAVTGFAVSGRKV